MTEKRITPKAPEAAGTGTDHAAARVTKTSAKKTSHKKLSHKKLSHKKH
jgi:hypothetical protein